MASIESSSTKAGAARAAWPGSALAVLALLTIAVGTYMAFLRPPLLPEDVRALGVDPNSLAPSLFPWLSLVFATWGAFIIAFGVLLCGVASALRTGRVTVLRWATALALLIAFGRFLWSNVVLRSDFLWLIALLFLLSVVAAILLVLVKGGGAQPRS